jgi:hypothetical protein
MDTLLVRLKAYDPRRGYVLRTFNYRGIKFQAERGWYRVTSAVGDYLRTVHARPRDENSPIAFDVCTEDQAQAIDSAEKKDAAGRQNATHDLALSVGRGERGIVTTADLAGGAAPPRAPLAGGEPAPAGAAGSPAAVVSPTAAAPAGGALAPTPEVSESAASRSAARKDKS